MLVIFGKIGQCKVAYLGIEPLLCSDFNKFAPILSCPSLSLPHIVQTILTHSYVPSHVKAIPEARSCNSNVLRIIIYNLHDL